MCGIVGYLGKRNPLEVVISGLEKLEYRGYDSAGVALATPKGVEIIRAVGKLQSLKSVLSERGAPSEVIAALGHTRWATHGKPAEHNAHPHTVGRVSVIHNGIIENYLELHEELLNEGASFQSETDTEIAAHLLFRELKRGSTGLDALRATCKRIRGSYAFVALDAENPNELLIAKSATPIVIGVGDDETIVASDIPAVLPYTRQVIILEDGDLARVTKSSIEIEHGGEPVSRPVQQVTWDPVTAQKGGYKHYMLKEIHEQVAVVADTLRGRLLPHSPFVALDHEIRLTNEEINKVRRIVLVACGTAWHACLTAKFYLEAWTKIPCEVDYASEFRYRRPVFDETTLVMAISQSGETADTLAAIELVRQVAPTLVVCNVMGSSLSRRSREVLYTRAGPEISVASTKAFTTQLAATYLLALYLGVKRGTLSLAEAEQRSEELARVPTAIDHALHTSEKVEALARVLQHSSDFLYLGRGLNFPIALEGALKLKEISYIHAEGYPAGEMKHGPIALIDENLPVVVVLQKSDELFEKTLSSLREVESRGAKIIAVTDTENNKELKRLAYEVIEVPHISEWTSPMVLSIPLQLLAYHIAVGKGTDVDLPRNLAKSVTVE